MFTKILIANRGEIACRIMRTCQRMGIHTVAVYSEADERALHVDIADEAYLIGASPARQSYLKAHTIIDVARSTGAQAIHPGYGFLSENADFVEAVEAAGLTFIGPKSSVIRVMGDKIQAKELARQAIVSLVPGSALAVTTAEEVIALAKTMGYPLILKAAAGGGGKGMRVVQAPEEIVDYLQRATNEATSSFGDGRVFVEKYLDSPRHIEIQILADHFGTVLHLGERDCSLQRRHQKVIEESPSPFMTPDLRQAMTQQAVDLVRQAGYTSAGTVEFMVTSDRQFYFLEMNTRLQVEHPVTEMVTGLDLVEQMIRIAAGEPLSFSQDQVTFTGHAIEARLYAEDASQNFMPSSGRITRFDLHAPNLRVDTGVEAGSEISVFYDPMIAKVLAHAPTREVALQKLQQGLAHLILEGPTHNAGFLQELLLHPRVIKGDFHTHFIETEMPFQASLEEETIARSIAAALYQQTVQEQRSDWIVVEKGQGIPVSKDLSVKVDWRPSDRCFVATIGDKVIYGHGSVCAMDVDFMVFGRSYDVQVMSPPVWALYSHIQTHVAEADNLIVKAPMPGILVSLPIAVGDHVKPGQTLAVIEAMKMENALKSPAAATVKDILVAKGDSLFRNQVLVKLG